MKRFLALFVIVAVLMVMIGGTASTQVAGQQATQAATMAATTAAASDPLGGATTFAKADKQTDVTVMLDYTPNTNHLGIYTAQALGYYKDANLNVTIQQPGDVAVEQIVGTGKAQFGVSYEDQGTFAIASGQPIVSIAAIIQHDTSAFASLHDKHPLKTPADLAGLRYGAFGSPIEQPTINLMTKCFNASATN